MKWIIKFLASAVVLVNCATCDVNDAEVIDALTPESQTEPALALDQDRAGTEPIKYDGAQLWRINYSDQLYRNAVSELQKQFEVSMWNLQMTNTSESFVDMFVKSGVVDEASTFLRRTRVPFDVVIKDVQDSINKENPPLSDVELWQNRNGELITLY